MVKYIIDKGDNLECSDVYGFKPIHILLYYQNEYMIKYIIDKGFSILCETTSGAASTIR